MTREEEIKERAEKATKGPWKYLPCVDGAYDWDDLVIGEVKYRIVEQCRPNQEIRSDDYAFIANARDDIPYLISHNEELQKRVTDMESVIKLVKEYEKIKDRAQSIANVEYVDMEEKEIEDTISELGDHLNNIEYQLRKLLETV